MLRQLPDSTARLVAALGNPEQVRRSSAVQLLAQIGSASIPALIMTLGQADQNARSAAAERAAPDRRTRRAGINKDANRSRRNFEQGGGPGAGQHGSASGERPAQLLPAWPSVAQFLPTQMKPDVKAVLDKTSTGDLPLIKAAFELSDADICASAGQALARIGKPAVPYLVEALHGGDDGMAQAAANPRWDKWASRR